MTTYLCAAGKGEVTRAFCLNCARKDENTCGFEYSLLKNMLEDDGRTGVHVSDLIGCLRKAYYERTEKGTPEYIHHRLPVFVGKGVHAYLESQKSMVFSAEVPVSGWGVVGTADVVYEDGRLVDYKTLRKMDTYFLPYPSHALQLNMYAAMLAATDKNVSELYVQYIDVNGPSKCPKCNKMVVPAEGGKFACPECGRERASYHPGVHLVEVPMMDAAEIKKTIQSRAQELSASVDLLSPPKGEPSPMCSFCKFRGICSEKEH